MYLFFDTETTGLPRNYRTPASDVSNWPRLVQLAWLLTDDDANAIATAEYIVKPVGFTIPAEASRIHGITTEIATQRGVDLRSVLAAVTPDLEKASTLVAHNIQFDEKILGAEFLRAGYPNHVESKRRLCTMVGATDYCRLPGPYGYKWPTLQELYMKLFNEPFTDAHRALVDVRVCAKCYFELKRRKIMA